MRLNGVLLRNNTAVVKGEFWQLVGQDGRRKLSGGVWGYLGGGCVLYVEYIHVLSSKAFARIVCQFTIWCSVISYAHGIGSTSPKEFLLLQGFNNLQGFSSLRLIEENLSLS